MGNYNSHNIDQPLSQPLSLDILVILNLKLNFLMTNYNLCNNYKFKIFYFFQIGLKPLFYIKECKQYLGISEENKTIGEIKAKTNKLDYEVLNISVYQNLSNAPTENTDISDFPIIHQSNGTVKLNVFKINCV